MKRLTMIMWLLLFTVCIALAATAGDKDVGGTATAGTEMYAMAKKPAAEDKSVAGNPQMYTNESSQMSTNELDSSLDHPTRQQVDVRGPRNWNDGEKGGTATAGTVEDVALENGTNDEYFPPGYAEAKTESTSSPHISESVNTMVITLIPFLALLFFTIWKWDQARFTRLLLQIWGVVKDTDNFFANPSGAIKNQIDIDGLNVVKKRYAINKIKETLTPDEVNTVVKKTGNIGNAIELAMTTFKYAPTLIKGIGSLVKLIK